MENKFCMRGKTTVKDSALLEFRSTLIATNILLTWVEWHIVFVAESTIYFRSPLGLGYNSPHI